MDSQNHPQSYNLNRKQKPSRGLGKPFLERLEERLVPTANPLETAVTNLYFLGLNRLPDPAGLASHVASLENGASTREVAASILNSVEHCEQVVSGLYRTYLNREADTDGLRTFTRAMASGMGEDQVAAFILGSREFSESLSDKGFTQQAFVWSKEGVNRYSDSLSDKEGVNRYSDSLSDEGFTQALYALVLHREADTQGQSSGIMALQSGLPRRELALAFLESRERSANLAADLYENILGRTPSLGEATGWGAGLSQAGYDLSQAAADFAASPEGFRRLESLDNPQAFSRLSWWVQDTRGPGVSSFTQPATRDAGPIVVEVVFNKPVLVQGTPVIPFLLGGSARELEYRSGSGSAHLRFEYQPVVADAPGNQGTLDVVTGGEVIRLPIGASISDWGGNAIQTIQDGSTQLVVMGAFFQPYPHQNELSQDRLNEIMDSTNPMELGGFLTDPETNNPFYDKASPKLYWHDYVLPTLRPATNGVKVYKVYYNSFIPEQGNRPILATGLLTLPITSARTLDLVSYQHGTVFSKGAVPSECLDVIPIQQYADSYETRLAVAAFGGQGSVVIAADYFGMGDSLEPEAYTVKASGQQACLDLYRAAERFLAAKDLEKGKFNLSGWSAGGLVTMQFLEKLESLGVEVDKVGAASSPAATLAGAYKILFDSRPGSTIEVPDAKWLNCLFVLTPFAYEYYYKKPGFARSVFDPHYYDTAKDIYERTPGTNLRELLGKLPPYLPRPGGTGGVIDLFRPEYADKAYFSGSELADCYRLVAAYDFFVTTDVRLYCSTQDEAFSLEVTKLPALIQDIFNPGMVTAIEVQGASHRGNVLSAIADQVEWFNGR